MIELINYYWAVEVPEETVHYELYDKEDHPLAIMVYLKDKMFKPGLPVPIIINPGTWEIVCTSKEVTEEQAKGIVGSSDWYFPVYHIRYIDYVHPFDSKNKQAWDHGYKTAVDSLRSMLYSKGCDLNNNYLILKKTA